MALVNCRECKKEISDKATTCPHCGHVNKKPTQYNIGSFLLLGLVLFFGYFMITARNNDSFKTNLAIHESPKNKKENCDISKIKIDITNFSFENSCQHSDCTSMKGAAIITNNCSIPIGVEVQITGYNKNNTPIATQKYWPNSINNLPVGQTVISLDQRLDYSPEISTITLTPTHTKQYKN
jgi:hypothetical protein